MVKSVCVWLGGTDSFLYDNYFDKRFIIENFVTKGPHKITFGPLLWFGFLFHFLTKRGPKSCFCYISLKNIPLSNVGNHYKEK